MGHGVKQSELLKLEDRAYNQLKEGIYRTKYAGGVFKCPFCVEKKNQEYVYDDLLQHARIRGQGSKTMSLKQQAQHIALSSYLRKYCSPKAPSKPSNEVGSHGGCDRRDTSLSGVLHSPGKKMNGGHENDNTRHQRRMPRSYGVLETHVEKGAAENVPAEEGEIVDEAENASFHTSRNMSSVLCTSEEKMHAGQDENHDTRPGKMQKHPGEQGTQEKQDKGKKFVFPWKGVIKNVPVELKNGKYIGEGGNRLKEHLIGQGFKPLKVTPIWNYNGYSGCSVVDFGGDWPGFSNAMKFEKAFEFEQRGRRDWYKARYRGDKLFGWVASEEDFHSHDLVGKHLQKYDLKSINDIEAEEERKTRSLVSQLHSTIEAKDLQYKVMESKLQAASISMNLVIKESDAMTEAHNKEMSEMCESQRKDTKRMLVEHRRIIERLEAQRKRLRLREKDLEKREARNENEQRDLSRKQRKNELAYQMQKEADMKLLKLAEEQKREKEALHNKINNLRKELDHKQALELKIEQLRGAMQVMKHMEHQDMEAKKKMEEIAEELKEHEEDLEAQEDINQTLIIKENKSKEELQEARKELINGLQSASSRGRSIGVKIVGVLDGKPFEVGAKAKYSDDMASVKATEWWSLWETYLKDTSWRPFKRVSEKGINKEVIDEDDERLKDLRDEVGEEAYKAVVTALIELNESNAEDRNPVPELWNFKEERRAKLPEAAAYLLNLWKSQKRRR